MPPAASTEFVESLELLPTRLKAERYRRRTPWLLHFSPRLPQVQTHISFPLEGLCLDAFSNPSQAQKYDLYAVVQHHGRSMNNGHFTAFARDIDGSWYHFNDTRVSRCDALDVQAAQAYILFYQMRQEKLNIPFASTPPYPHGR